MQALVVKEERHVGDIICFLLESQFRLRAKRCPTASAALDLIRSEDPTLQLIICDDDVQNSDLFEFFKASGKVISFITLKNTETPKAVLQYPDFIIGTANLKDVPKIIKDIIEKAIKKGQIRTDGEDSEYCTLRTELLALSRPLKADVFVRLSDIRYVRVFQEGGVFSQNDLENYIVRKKIHNLFVRRKDCEKFFSGFEKELATVANSNPTVEKAAGLAKSVHEGVVELSQKLGFTPIVQEIAKRGVELSIKSATQNPALLRLLKTLTADGSSYSSSHAIAIAHVACTLSTTMDWPSGTTFQKLTYAAFFHDITLPKPSFSEIDSLKELEEKKEALTEQEIEAYKQHPESAAELVDHFKEVPQDVSTIIRQHHEQPDGKGFPKGLGSLHTSPLACLFIVAEDFVKFVHVNGPQDAAEHFLKQAKEKYSTGNFRGVIESFAKNKLNL